MYFPIPSLNGKYEIDKGGNVRNSKTKKIVNPRKGSSYYPFYLNNVHVWRCRESLIAEVFDKPNDFLPVPSLNNNYEINRRGILRNAKTKKKLRKYKSPNENCFFYSVKFNGVYHHRYLQQLMWEVHGVLPKVVYSAPAVSVTVQKGTEYFSFGSMVKCAKFLAEKEHYSFSWCNQQLQQRREEIFGWKIFYNESKVPDITRPSQFIKTRRHKNENN